MQRSIILLLGLLLGLSASVRASDIAIYGATNTLGLGDNLTIFNGSGSASVQLGFQASPGSGAFGISSTIEDITFDALGNLYAVGKPAATSNRAIYKSSANRDRMNILFEKDFAYDSTIDGSIAVSPTGTIAVYGAQNEGFGNS